MVSVRRKLPVPAQQMEVVLMDPTELYGATARARMSAPLLCFSAKLHGLGPLPFSDVAWFGVYFGRFSFFIRRLYFRDA